MSPAALLAAVALLQAEPERIAPMPGPEDHQAQVDATACVLYFRLEEFTPGVDSQVCARAGYGVGFMALHDGELRDRERQRAANIEAARKEGALIREARDRKEELQAPCEALAFGRGPGPDGGQELCDRAGWNKRGFELRAFRARLQAERDAAAMGGRLPDPAGSSCEVAPGGPLAALLGLVFTFRLRRRLS